MKIFDFNDHFYALIEMDHWHRRNMAAIKAVPGVRWVPAQKMWWIPGTDREKILALRYSHRAEIVSGNASTILEILPEDPMPELDEDPPLHNIVLRHYQRQGIARGLQLRRYINGDEQGLGKTIQSIATMVLANKRGEDVFPCIIICPASLKENWKSEIERFTECGAIILSDKNRESWPNFYHMGLAQFFICNYESAKKYFVLSMPTEKKAKSMDIKMSLRVDLFKSVIVDESQRVKDITAQTTKIVLRIAYQKKWVILLSGTPFVNRVLDLWSQLGIMGQSSRFAANEKVFKDRFCNGGRGGSNLKELNSMLNKFCFFRREKKDVAADLPSKDRQKILCDISTRQDYNYAFSHFSNWLQKEFDKLAELEGSVDDEEVSKKIKRAMNAEALVQMNALRRISARGKMGAAREFIDEVLEGGNKLIVFCILKEMVDQLVALYPHAVTITGSVDTHQRHLNVQSFQNNPECKLIICNIQAAGVGLTLTAASRVLFLEFPWTYAACVQAEDRAHRIGQKLPVMCTYLLAYNTIDEHLLDIIMEKKSLSQQITGATDDMEMSTIDNLLTLFTQKKIQPNGSKTNA